MAVTVTPETLRNYHKWHMALVSDATSADFWRTNFYLDLARIAVEVGLVFLIFFMLKPRAKNTPTQAQQGATK